MPKRKKIKKVLSSLVFRLSAKSGFTLLEISISIAILALIGALSLVSFTNSRNVRDLTTSGQNALSILRLAQSKALAGEDNSTWGVHLETAQFVLFRGTTYAGATYTKPYVLPSSVEIVNINLAGGGQDIVLKRINGGTDQTGNFDVRVKNSTTKLFSITVDGSGKVYQTGAAPSQTGTRVIDTRHRSFNLGWSIKTYTTLTLTFSDPPNPDIINNVTMATYFDPGQTKFDWSGTVTVGGQSQTLRIHTTNLTDTNTILSVDRDCRKNTKKVQIKFDTRDIATYEADCRTVTVGPYGGAMSEP